MTGSKSYSGVAEGDSNPPVVRPVAQILPRVTFTDMSIFFFVLIIVHPLPHEVSRSRTSCHSCLLPFRKTDSISDRLYEEGKFPIDRLAKTYKFEDFDEAVEAM